MIFDEPIHLPKPRGPVLVTGGGGFIGTYLVNRLLGMGISVRVLEVWGKPLPEEWGNQVEVMWGDVRDSAGVSRAMEEIGTVYHLAAVVGDEAPAKAYDEITVHGTYHVLSAAAEQGARALLASSITVYGERIQDSVLDEDLPFGKAAGLYGRSKQAQEKIARDLETSAGLQLSIVRPGNVFGIGSRLWVDGVIAELKRGTPSLIGSGNFNAGLCHVENLVDMMILASALPEGLGETFNVSDGSSVTWRQYFTDLARIAGAPRPKAIHRGLARRLSVFIERAWRRLRLRGRPPLTYEAYNLVGSDHRFPIAKAQERLGYVPQVGYRYAILCIEEHLRGVKADG